jgi:hypothetical protein
MPSPATHIDEAMLPASELIRLRASWLGQMHPDDRDELDGLPLRRVDDRFRDWLDRRARVGDDGGG